MFFISLSFDLIISIIFWLEEENQHMSFLIINIIVFLINNIFQV